MISTHLSRSSRSIPRRLGKHPRLFSSTSTLRKPSSQTTTPTTHASRVYQPSIPKPDLPSLISIYHQTPRFITLENLDEAIDNAFAGTQEQGTPAETPYMSVRMRMNLMKEGIDYEEGNRNHSDTPMWSHQVTPRTRLVKEALFGTMAGGMPTLEIVEEAVADGLEGIDESPKGMGKLA